MLFVGMGTEVIVFLFSAFERPFEVEEESGSGVVNNAGGAVGGQPIIINGPIVAGGSTATPTPIVAGGSTATPTPVIATEEPSTPLVATDDEKTPTPAPAPGPIVIGGGAPVVMGGAPVMPAGAQAAMGSTNIAPVVAPANIEEMDKATEEYVEKVRELTEAIQRISQQTEALGRSMSEMDTLSRNLTGVNALYEVHLRSAGGQLNAIDQVNDQTKKMAQQIEELNNLYARMIEAMTSRIDRPQI